MTRSERLHPEVRALLAMMDAQGAPPLESQDPVEARISRMEPMKMLGGEPVLEQDQQPSEAGRLRHIEQPAGSYPIS